MAPLDLNSPYPVSSRGSGRRRRMLAMQSAAAESEQTSGESTTRSPARAAVRTRSRPKNDIPASTTINRIRELVVDADPRTWVFTGDGFGFETRLARRSWSEHFADVIRGRLARAKDVVLDTTANGHMLAGLLRNLDWQVLRFHPDVVVISAGSDDALRAESSRDSLQAALTELTELLNDAGCVVILCSPPVAAGVSQQQMQPLRQILRSVADRCQAVFVDHYTRWSRHQAHAGSLADLLDSSGTVPSAAGHRKLARDLIIELGIARPTGDR